MDQSTGKPRANETVSVTVTISDNAGTNICQSTQNATTNDFGMLSVQVGNASTFSNIDWSKLPLWVSASVGGVTIGKSQILNIPVAEHAKHWGTLTQEMLTSKVWHSQVDDCSASLTFNKNFTGTFSRKCNGIDNIDNVTETFHYKINGDMIAIQFSDNYAQLAMYCDGTIYGVYYTYK